MVLAIVLILMVVGSVIFHFWSPWWFTPIASNWGAMDTTIMITFWVTGFVFVVINLFLAYCVVKFFISRITKRTLVCDTIMTWPRDHINQRSTCLHTKKL